MSKVTVEVFRWFYGKRKLLAGGAILLLVGVGLGMFLTSSQPTLLAKIHRLFSIVASSSSTTFTRLWHSIGKRNIPSSSPIKRDASTESPSTPHSPSLTDQLLREGVELRDRGDTTHAVYRLQQALQIEPNNAIALTELAKTYELMRLYDYARELRGKLEQMGAVASLPYDSGDLGPKPGVPTPAPEQSSTRDVSPATTLTKAELEEMYNTAYRAFDAGKSPEALKQLDAIDAQQPDLAASKNLRGVILMWQGKYDQAEAALTEAARLDPKFWNARFNLAEISFRKKDWAEARNRFEQLLSTGQSDLAKEASQLIQYKILLTYLMEGKSNMVDSILAKLELSRDTPAFNYGKAAAALQQKNQKEAGNLIGAAEKNYSPQLNKLFAAARYGIHLAPSSLSEEPKAVTRSKFEQSQQAFRQRDFATALKLVDEADKVDANQPATLNLRGEILMQQGKFDDAEAAFKKAAKLDPKLRDAQYNLAQIPFKKKEYAKARDRFETLYKRIPGGDKNQAAELIKFKIYMTLLMEGKESRAHSMLEEFQFTDTPALYYAQAAWEYKHNNSQKAEEWTSSANKIYSPALNSVFADAFYDVGWIQRPDIASSASVGQHAEGSSLSTTTSAFAKYAMKLREQGMTQIPPLTESTTLYQAARNAPSNEALQALARKDYAYAVSLVEQSANQGHAPSQTLLAWLYAQGKGVPQDYQKAAEFLTRAADQGDAAGQVGLAFLYSSGKGVPQDYRKAVELLQQAVDRGNALAQVNLGWLYHEGKSVPQDYRKAVELFQKAADQGYAVGQAYLASAYAEGKGVSRDYQKARDLFQKTFDHGPDPHVLNDFAWFLATCADASQRNGKQAVEYATKACELTEWKSANLIGTLAAAYAETDDFDMALKYQKQAMDIPDSDYPSKEEMARTIELYRHRKPYREQ
jgi:TPR repeat protein